MAKRKIGDVLWLALVCAKDDRLAFIDAYNGDETNPAVIRAKQDIAAFDALQIKLFGTNRTELQAMVAKMQPRNILQMIANGEEFEAVEHLRAVDASPASVTEK